MNRNFFAITIGLCFAVLFNGCATMPDPKFTKFTFPKESAFVGDVDRPYQEKGKLTAKVNFETLDPNHDEKELCQNYYNRAVLDLLEKAKKRGADAVIKVQSVTYLNTGEKETADTPECFDDGQEGQSVVQGMAVKWLGKRSKHYPAKIKVEEVNPAPTASPSASPSSVSGVQDQQSHLGGGELAIPRDDLKNTKDVGIESAPSPVVEPSPANAGSPSEVRVGDDPSSEVQIRMEENDSFLQPKTAGGGARAGQPGTVPTQLPTEGMMQKPKSAPRVGHPGDPTGKF